jgi:NTP pyrophosphatase (non-canonical NTP hydrolase)
VHVREFQRLIKDLFYHNDSRRGRERTFLWLVEELGELSAAVMREDVENIKEEMADLIAWCSSLANLYDIDLEECLRMKYPGYCLVCEQAPCTCPVSHAR